eukprot:TRINITY_DN658_c0_g1_i1.p1 TRINITY_DN658_c0_g1~~TRINITY_DN658_c0_g1_i1.p1  ORF type:complete len:548 (+),score=145.23 TRINITY_DN658_c0_g1_i1:55-1698(+)
MKNDKVELTAGYVLATYLQKCRNNNVNTCLNFLQQLEKYAQHNVMPYKLRISDDCFHDSIHLKVVSSLLMKIGSFKKLDFSKTNMNIQIIRTLFEPLTTLKIEILILNDCNLTGESIPYLSAIIVKTPNLKQLHLENNPELQSAGEMFAKAIIHPQCTLRTLKFRNLNMSLASNGVSWNNFLNNVGESKIKEIFFCNCNFQLEQLEILLSNISGSSFIKHMAFHDNNFGDSGVDVICKELSHLPLTGLTLYNCGVTTVGLQAIISSINNTLLAVLDLGCNDLSNKSGALLAELITNHLSLRALGLSKCGLTAEDIVNLSAVIPNCKLQRLDLRSNQLGVVGTDHLAMAIENSSVESLTIQADDLTPLRDELLNKTLEEVENIVKIHTDNLLKIENSIKNNKSRAEKRKFAESSPLSPFLMKSGSDFSSSVISPIIEPSPKLFASSSTSTVTNSPLLMPLSSFNRPLSPSLTPSSAMNYSSNGNGISPLNKKSSFNNTNYLDRIEKVMSDWTKEIEFLTEESDSSDIIKAKLEVFQLCLLDLQRILKK